MAHALGIDLGTSNSVVSVIQGGRPLVIPGPDGHRLHPSVVSFGYGGSVVVGHAARRQVLYNPSNTIWSAKRLLGRSFHSEEVRKSREVLPYELVEGPNHDVRIRAQGRTYSLQEISAFILRHLRQIAEDHLGEAVDKAVITVPAYFNDSQRQATRDAGTIAGLDVLRIVNEPTAACLAYGVGRAMESNVAVYDLGGGTFDVSILRVLGDVFEVVATAGDTFLGGDDFDENIVKHLVSGLKEADQVRVRRNPIALQKLKDAAESAKCSLSDSELARVKVPALYKDDRGVDQDFEATLTRAQFDRMSYGLIARTFQVCDQAMRDARLTNRDISAVVLVGGMTRSPVVRDAVQAYFDREPESGVNPDEVVSVGAAVQASSLVNALSGPSGPDALLIDVTPQSLGVGTVEGFVERVIERNSPIPTHAARVFTTTRDHQTEVRIRVFQGESRAAADSELLGQFSLVGLPPAPRGECRVRVAFDIDASGILNVSAEDIQSGRSASIRIDASVGLRPEEVEEMRFDSLGF
ncbi:molecular chaperone DnaK [Myxococcota bacterium]|nr:molecular chaperone DnaK [Myxococcota bacterium]